MSITEVEQFLLQQYAKRENADHPLVEQMFDLLLENKFDMNSVGVGGPLFCLMLELRPILRIGVIIKMVQGGLDFKNVHMCGIAHIKLIKDLETRYSDTLWGVFIFVCQHTNFVESLPTCNMFEIFFGGIHVTRTGVVSDYCPQPRTFKILLKYDMGKRIKKNVLKPINFSLRHCIKQMYPEILDLILNS